MLNDTSFICASTFTGFGGNVRVYKITFGVTSVNWGNELACTGGTWNISNSEWITDSTKTYIYCLLSIGFNMRIQYVKFSLDNGTVLGDRYQSSIYSPNIYVFQLSMSGNYIHKSNKY